MVRSVIESEISYPDLKELIVRTTYNNLLQLIKTYHNLL